MVDEVSALSVEVAELLRSGVLDRFDPAYDVALAAIAVGYERLTRAQRKLFDRVLAPALAGAHPVTVTGSSKSTNGVAPPRAPPKTPPWKPIREAPADTAVEVAVSVEGKTSALTFPCRKEGSNWVSEATGRPVHIRPTHWREWSMHKPDDPLR